MIDRMHLPMCTLLCIAQLFVCLAHLVYGRPQSKGAIIGVPRLTNSASGSSLQVHVTNGTPLHRFECKLSNKRQPKATVTWYKNGEEILDQPKDRFQTKNEGMVLVMKNFHLSDTGTVIGCKVTNPVGFIWRNTTLTVISEEDLMGHTAPAWHLKKTHAWGSNAIEVAPFFTFENGANTSQSDYPIRNIEAPFGDSITLHCPAHGQPVPVVIWLKDGNPVTEPFLEKNDSTVYEIVDGRQFDSGNYTCIAKNQYGTAQLSYQVNFHPVNIGPPVIESDYPKNVTAIIGQSAVLECKFHSGPHPDIEWFAFGYEERNGSFSLSDTPITINQAGEDKYDLSDPGRLVIWNTTFEDSGKYTCLISNAYGRIAESAYLTVQPVPPAVLPVNEWMPKIVIGIGALLAVTLIATGTCIWKKHQADKLVRKIQTEIPCQIRKRVVKVVQRQDSTQSAASILGEIFLEDVWQPAGSSLNSGSIITSRATTISHCNSTVEYELPHDEHWEYPREQLQDFNMEKPIGEGAFGKVIKARAPNIKKDGKVDTIVAVKTSKDTATEQEFVGLIGELEIMKAIGHHENIINLLGCCTVGGPLYVIVEYAPNGNLRDFLRAHRRNEGYEQPIGIPHLSQHDLGRFAYEISCGMEYLSSKRVIHRDLAARNILVAENNVMKIADFGLAKDVYGQEYYRKMTNGRLPVKWMAPEALFDSIYTHKSDIWAFGVLLWEIMTFGATPYPSISDPEKLLSFLKSGRRMDQPKMCPIVMYELMLRCWQQNPVNRPSFIELTQMLDVILTQSEYLKLSQDEHSMMEVNQQYMMVPSFLPNQDLHATTKTRLLNPLSYTTS